LSVIAVSQLYSPPPSRSVAAPALVYRPCPLLTHPLLL
jgi:hypothetical protein